MAEAASNPAPPQPPSTSAGGTAARRAAVMLAAVLLPLLLLLLLHRLLASPPTPDTTSDRLLRLTAGQRIDDASLQPPAAASRGMDVRLPLVVPRHGGPPSPPTWVRVRFTLERAADTTWMLSFGHRTAVLVYLDGRLLANSVPLTEADLPPRNLQIGERSLEASIPADWLPAGAHEIAIRLGGPGPGGRSLSPLLIGSAADVAAADRPRDLWLAARVLTALSALVIGTLLLFAWLVERREQLYLWSALQLLMLALLLSPYLLSEPVLPSPWWRMLLDAADVVAKGLAPVVIASWAQLDARWIRRAAFGYIALALVTDLVAAYHLLPWTDFRHVWPWWALGSRLAVLGLALGVALRAMTLRPGPYRFGTAALAALALWVWTYVSWGALVMPGRGPVVDLNVAAYAGWALWVAVLLHRRLVGNRRRELRLREALARQLAERSEALRRQYLELQESERARATAAERERLLAEMHDGVGAQLTSAKMLASSGQLSTAELVDMLDDCLREMRLTVDALGVTDGDLGLLLASLRSRLEPALRAGGVTLEWRVDATPCVRVLQGAGGRELVRILQEALSNVLHHARACQVEIGTGLTDDGRQVQVWVADDGCGFAADRRPGRGLRNMRQRAQRLGARIEWREPPGGARGTLLEIALPLDDGPIAP